MSGGIVLTPTPHSTSEGIDVGSDEEVPVGDWVGTIVGSVEGLEDAVAVGGLVGVTAGKFVGVVDGATVDGAAVGFTNGSLDLISVGRLLVMAVSIIVGTGLGLSDGAILSLVLGVLEGDVV